MLLDGADIDPASEYDGEETSAEHGEEVSGAECSKETSGTEHLVDKGVVAALMVFWMLNKLE